jgi:hypothetical protein
VAVLRNSPKPKRLSVATRRSRLLRPAASTATSGIAIRGGTPTTSIVTGTNPITVTLTGTKQPQAGDVLLIIHGNNFYTAAAMPTPTVGGSTTGVTAVTNGSADAGTNLAHIKSYTYVVGSTGDLTVSVTETGLGDEEKSLDVYVLSGVDTSTPVDIAATATGTTATSQVAPSVTPTSATPYLICHVNTGGAGVSSTYTPPGSMTETYDTVVAATYEATGAVQQLGGPGATGTRTFTATGSNPYAALSVALTTASAGSTTATATVVGAGTVTAAAATTAGQSVTGAGTVTAAVQQSAGQTVAGAGTVNAPASTVTAGSSATGAGATSTTSAQTATASQAGAGTVTAPVTVQAGSSVTGAGSVTASAGGNTNGTASVAGAGSVTALVTVSAGSSATGAGAVSTTARLAAGAAVAGVGSITAPVTVAAPSTVTGAGAVTASGAAPNSGTATVTGAGSVSAPR